VLSPSVLTSTTGILIEPRLMLVLGNLFRLKVSKLSHKKKVKYIFQFLKFCIFYETVFTSKDIFFILLSGLHYYLSLLCNEKTFFFWTLGKNVRRSKIPRFSRNANISLSTCKMSAYSKSNLNEAKYIYI
jgi:hypothetical protein